MKCPRCGASNKNGAPACYRCGAPPDSGEEPAGRASAADTIWFPGKDRRPPDPILQRGFVDAGAPFISLDGGVPAADRTEKAGIGKLSSLRDGENITVVIPPEPEPEPDPAVIGRRKRRVRRALSVLILLALAAGVGYGGFRLIKSVLSAYGGWRQSRLEASLPVEPLVERVLINGEVWHKITFYGKDGERVLIEDPRESKAIRDGVAEFYLSDDYFISGYTDTGAEQIAVTLSAILFSASGEETPITVPGYTIDIPESSLKIILPGEQNVETNENRIQLKIKVTPGSRVLIRKPGKEDGDNVSDLVDAEGYLSTTVEVHPVGVNTIQITVETEGHRRTVYDLLVNRPELDVAFTLDSEPPSSTHDASVTLQGVTEPGAVITTESRISGSAQVDPETGRFKFKVLFSRYGENLIDISVQAGDGRVSQITYRIERKPEISEYTKSAWVMDYPYLSASASSLIGKIFECKGTVLRKLDDETSNYYLFDVGDGESAQVIVLEYNGSTELKDGTYYILFADVIGTYNEYPLLAGRFIKLQ